MEKKFKCKDEVIFRCKIEYGNQHWTYGIFSHYEYHQDDTFASLGCLSLNINDWDILPYEGNEYLVGTTNEPETEVRLEEGELLLVADSEDRVIDCISAVRKFVKVLITVFVTNGGNWSLAIRFRDFDPSNMEETRKHILCVKNGKIVRYRG